MTPTAPALARPERAEFGDQYRAIAARVEAVRDLQYLAKFLVDQSSSVSELLRTLQLVQMQVQGARKAAVAEARAVGYFESEIAELLRINVDDFLSRYPC